MQFIFRDDDISFKTNLDQFVKVHEYFMKRGCVHTIAVIAKDIQNAPSLIDYIRSNRKTFDVQIHCWEHLVLSELTEEQLRIDIENAKAALMDFLKVIPTVLYPPWNKSSEMVERIAKEYDLDVSYKKISLSQFVKCGWDVEERVVNFHYWADEEAALIDTALRINNELKLKCK